MTAKTDRELLELAAKAAGIGICDFSNTDVLIRSDVTSPIDDQYPVYWNPLTDDGDALRLAVKLGMVLAIDSEGYCQAIADNHSFDEPNGADQSAATRRAIVRAAAAIGETL